MYVSPSIRISKVFLRTLLSRPYNGFHGLIYVRLCRKWAQETDMIKKVKSGYKVLSEKGKNLGGPYKSKAAAQKRLRQVEYFKHRKG
jgi:hypothetical protein